MAELQAEGLHFVGEAELGRLWPERRDPVGGYARPDHVDGDIDPFACAPVGVALRRGRRAHVDRSVVAGAITHVRLDNVEEGLVARPVHAIGEIVRMGAATLPGNGVDRLDVVGAGLVENLVGQADHLVLPRTRLERFGDALVGAVDDGGGHVEQHDFVHALDLPGVKHGLLSVKDRKARRLQGEQHRRFADIHANRHVGDPFLLEELFDFFGGLLEKARLFGNGAAQPQHARLAALRVQPGCEQPVMGRGRSEVPQVGLGVGGKERIAADLVARPFADHAAGDVADVVVVEAEHRAQAGISQRPTRSGDPVTPQPVEVDALLEVDAHRSGRGDGPGPVPVGVHVAVGHGRGRIVSRHISP